MLQLISESRFWIVLTCAALLSACASSPTGRSQMILKSDAELEQEGARQFAEIRANAPLVTDRATIDYIACVANAIVDVMDNEWSKLNWELAIIDENQVNAFVLPGGKISVYSGILQVAKNQDQLAAVIGHEVAHVTARHANERASRGVVTDIGVDIAAIILGGGHGGYTRTARDTLQAGAALGIFLPFTRAQESEADVVGLEYMAKAGFDPRESVILWKNMAARNEKQPPEWLSTHPSGTTRIDGLVAQYPKVLVLYNEAREAGKHPACSP